MTLRLTAIDRRFNVFLYAYYIELYSNSHILIELSKIFVTGFNDLLLYPRVERVIVIYFDL